MAMLETNVIIIVILLLLMVLMLFLFSLVILFACKPWRYLPLFRSSSFKVKVYSINRETLDHQWLIDCVFDYYLIGNENVLIDRFVHKCLLWKVTLRVITLFCSWGNCRGRLYLMVVMSIWTKAKPVRRGQGNMI